MTVITTLSTPFFRWSEAHIISVPLHYLDVTSRLVTSSCHVILSRHHATSSCHVLECLHKRKYLGYIRDSSIWGGNLKFEGGKSPNPGVPAGYFRLRKHSNNLFFHIAFSHITSCNITLSCNFSCCTVTHRVFSSHIFMSYQFMSCLIFSCRVFSYHVRVEVHWTQTRWLDHCPQTSPSRRTASSQVEKM